MRYIVDKYKNIWYVLFVDAQESLLMSKSKQGSQSPQKRPKLGTRHGAVFTVEPDALQKMGAEGLDSLIQFMGHAGPEDSTESEEV
jgi:hypothetical protein